MSSGEEIAAEMEAVQAVYGDDCHVISLYPPHIHVHLKPRTADVFSQQFVEATISMRAGPQYPEEPPDISITDSKGLDENRQKQLLNSIQDRAFELASCLMLVALCEEAVERLTAMNYPDGDCPLCLYPLLDEESRSYTLPFMKLMSCFHCFHCDCIIRWWDYTKSQSQKEIKNSSTSSAADNLGYKHDKQVLEESMGKCPLCRKAFLTTDIEHVLDLVGTSSSHLESTTVESETGEEILLLHSDSEKIRRLEFEAISKLQQEKGGLIEPKTSQVLLPGMFLPQPVASTSTDESQDHESATATELETNRTNNPGLRKHSNPNMRKHRTAHNSRKQGRHWIRKDGTGNQS